MCPIKGITDRNKPAFPELGVIRKGGEATRNQAGQVTRVGADLTFFRFVSEREEVTRAFAEAYPKEPKQLIVYLPYASVEENFDAWMEEHAASGLVRRCDGEQIVQWWDANTGKHHFEPRPCLKTKGESCGCKRVGRLKVFLPELMRAGFIGFTTVLTSSVHDLLSIQSSLEAAAAVSPTGLSGIPFLLWREGKKISTPRPGSASGRARMVKSLLRIAPAREWLQAQIQGAEQRSYAALGASRVLALPEPAEVNGEGGTVTPGTLSAEAFEPFDDDVDDGEYEALPEETPTELPNEPPTLDPLAARRADFARYLEGKTPGWIGLFRQRFHDEYKVSLDEANLDTLDLAWARIHEKKAVTP